MSAYAHVMSRRLQVLRGRVCFRVEAAQTDL
jgi:hypothetical protein